jgi:hypothetical protein
MLSLLKKNSALTAGDPVRHARNLSNTHVTHASYHHDQPLLQLPVSVAVTLSQSRMSFTSKRRLADPVWERGMGGTSCGEGGMGTEFGGKLEMGKTEAAAANFGPRGSDR